MRKNKLFDPHDHIPSSLLNIEKVVVSTKTLRAQEYMKCCAQRAGKSGEAVGSRWPDLSTQGVDEAILSARWFQGEHPLVNSREFNYYVSTNMPIGRKGISKLSEIADHTEVHIEDLRGTKCLVVVTSRIVLIPEKVSSLITEVVAGEEVVRVFFPGPPTRLHKRPYDSSLCGKRMTAKEARDLGFTSVLLDESVKVLEEISA